MKRILPFAAIAEAATGLAILAAPALVVRLLLGAELTGPGIPVARVAGIALIGLGVACWPGQSLGGMLTYGVLLTPYLAYLGLAGGYRGLGLWLVIGLHLVLTALLARQYWRVRSSSS